MFLFHKPICYGCERPIDDGEYIKAEGYYFHSNHFLCYKCSKPLTQGYVMYENHAYCQADYIEYCRPKCSKCNKGIQETGIIAELNGVEKHFHMGCFTCANCGARIEEFFSVNQNGDPICFRCPMMDTTQAPVRETISNPKIRKL